MRCSESHRSIREQTCAECGLEVDQYGNTEDQFDFCSFPDCGCDGARLCMAPSGANFASVVLNIERGSLPMLTQEKQA